MRVLSRPCDNTASEVALYVRVVAFVRQHARVVNDLRMLALHPPDVASWYHLAFGQ